MQNTLVFGASPNKLRHSNKAVKSLVRHNRNVVPIGLRKGTIEGVDILTGKPNVENVNTVLLYVGAKRQPEFYDYLLGLKPERIVFNPGTENPEFQKMVEENKIEVVKGCALVMINARQL